MQDHADLIHPDTQASVLIVDDDPTNVAVLQGFLKDANYNALEAFGGRQAMEILNQITPDLILLDLMMPELNGFEVCRLVKASPQWQGIPIIIVTALDEIEDYNKAMECGANDFLTKPVQLHLLLERVNEHLQTGLMTKELRQNETLYRRLIESFPDAIMVHDNDRLTFVNPAGMHLLGATRAEELIGKALSDFIHPMYLDIAKDNLLRMREADRATPPMILQFIRMDYAIVNVEVIFSPFTNQDQPAALLVMRKVDSPIPHHVTDHDSPNQAGGSHEVKT